MAFPFIAIFTKLSETPKGNLLLFSVPRHVLLPLLTFLVPRSIKASLHTWAFLYTRLVYSLSRTRLLLNSAFSFVILGIFRRIMRTHPRSELDILFSMELNLMGESSFCTQSILNSIGQWTPKLNHCARGSFPKRLKEGSVCLLVQSCIQNHIWRRQTCYIIENESTR